MQRALPSSWLWLAWLVGLAAPASAQQPLPDLESFRLKGWGPDAQIVGGGGFGLGGDMDNPFVGRLRLGALYAREPWIWNAGVEGQIGALREWGFGGEIEVNHFKGMFASLGVGTAQLEDAALNVTVGYTIVGLEWHHRFTSSEPQDALLLVVRAPLGMWWFLTQRDDNDEDEEDKPTRGGERDANAPGPDAAAADADAAAIAAADAAQLANQVRVEQTLAVQYEQSGQLLQAEQALGRAYAYDPRPELLLDLARVEEAQGKLARAVADLERYLGSAVQERSAAQTEQAQAKLAELLPKLATLRLVLSHGAGDERIEVDGEPFRGATLGYDLRLDPGAHTLLVLRGERALARRHIELESGELLRLELDLDDPGALAQPPPELPGASQ
jgi:hypothetical protein